MLEELSADHRERFVRLVGETVLADASMERSLRHVYLNLPSDAGPIAVVPGMFGDLLKQTKSRVKAMAMEPRWREAVDGLLDDVKQIHDERNRLVHDTWLFSMEEYLGPPDEHGVCQIIRNPTNLRLQRVRTEGKFFQAPDTQHHEWVSLLALPTLLNVVRLRVDRMGRALGYISGRLQPDDRRLDEEHLAWLKLSMEAVRAEVENDLRLRESDSQEGVQ